MTDSGKNLNHIFSPKSVAVVGASSREGSVGRAVFSNILFSGYTGIVYPVNPNTNEILGDKCYSSLEALPVKPEVVDLVVPPKVTQQVVKTCKKLGIKKVWMQPGSESEMAIIFCRKNDMDVVHGVCVMVERRSRQM